jgi:hypothetical protein
MRRTPSDDAEVTGHRGVVLVDAANVVGARPDGWWRDRPGAARRLVESIADALLAGRVDVPVVVVLEGPARAGYAAGTADGLTVVHAAADADADLVSLARPGACVVTADRALRALVVARGADVVGPAWLLDRLAGAAGS